MRLPRDVSGAELAKRLERLGYRVTRQTGSHMRLTLPDLPEHHVTIPAHDALRIGTLRRSCLPSPPAWVFQKTKLSAACSAEKAVTRAALPISPPGRGQGGGHTAWRGLRWVSSSCVRGIPRNI
ncbi:MAG: type II toxin-antitoxin system HicA family toxin [Rhodocyclaceae bacterium]|nr:type II toxin-antitoxin system HicA family toxin [Rhodocyclaceae bacterium]